MYLLKIKYNSEVIKQNTRLTVHHIQMAAIINKNHAHGNDVRPVARKQNCALSEKGA